MTAYNTCSVTAALQAFVSLRRTIRPNVHRHQTLELCCLPKNRNRQ